MGGMVEDGRWIEGRPAEDELGVIDRGASGTVKGVKGGRGSRECSIIKMAQAEGDGAAGGGASLAEGSGKIAAEGMEKNSRTNEEDVIE